MASFKIVLKESDSDRYLTGEYPIKLRITHNRKIKYIDLNIRCFKEQVHAVPTTGLLQVDKSVQNFKDKNLFLSNKLKSVDSAITKLLDRNLSFSVDDIVREMQQVSRQSFFDYAKKLEKQLRKDEKIGTANAYKGGYRLLELHLGHSNLSFDEIDLKLLKAVETAYLIKHPEGLNGLSAYFRAVRAIFNHARNVDKIIPKDCYPFYEYKIKQKKTRKRAIKKPAIDKLINLNLDAKHHLFNPWNYFLFMFYCRGMNFSDLARLTYKKNIREGRIVYIRQKLKTEGTQITIKITEKIQEIIDRYPEKGKYIFPIITKKDVEEIYFEVKNKSQVMNNNLRSLATLAGVEAYLTTYVARHSWASIARNLGGTLAEIKQGLDHQNTKTTEIYLDDLDDEAVDNLSDKVMG